MRKSPNNQVALDAFIAPQGRDRSDARTPDGTERRSFQRQPRRDQRATPGHSLTYAELLKRITGAAFKEGEHAL